MASLFAKLIGSSDESAELTCSHDCDSVSDEDQIEEVTLEQVKNEGIGSHSKLMDAIASLDTTKRQKMMQRSEASTEVSEFTFNNQDGDKNGVKLHELMGSLANTPNHSEVKKLLGSVQRNQKVLEAPLHKHQADKIRRSVAYEATSKEVSKWDQVVQSNRKAEQLSFPLNQPVIGLQSTDQFVKKFKPSTPLEQEVYKILHSSKHNERANKQLTLAEEEALTSMSLEEAQERRAELQKTRAMLSYYEAKCHRKKKIKSKMYHRIQRKSKAKGEVEKLNARFKTDPEQATDLLSNLDKARAKERLTLKHRNTGKWAKGMTRFGKHDHNARILLAEQLQKSRELTKKPIQVAANEDEADGLADSGEGRHQVSLTDINNPWFTASDIDKQHNSDYQAKINTVQPVNDQELHTELHTSDDLVEDIFKTNHELFEEGYDKTEEIGCESLEGNDLHIADLKAVKSPSTALFRQQDDTGMSLSSMLARKPSDMYGIAPDLMINEGKAMHSANEHLLNIQEAFAEDDIIKVFQEEKQENVNEDKPKDVITLLPGWGAWAGAGANSAHPKHNRFLAKSNPTQPRRDEHLHHVVINEKRDKKLAVHQVNQLPFPFNTPEQFQSSVRAPIGSTWNTPSTVKQLTLPKVTTKMGTIIQPITAVEAFKKKRKRKVDNNQQMATDLSLNTRNNNSKKTHLNKFKKS